MKTTANNTQSSTHSKQTSIIAKLRWTTLILAMAALLCDLLGPSRVQAQSIDDPSSLAIFSNKDGGLPYAGLILYNGNLYGTTVQGGANGMGEIFKVSPTGQSGDAMELQEFEHGRCLPLRDTGPAQREILWDSFGRRGLRVRHGLRIHSTFNQWRRGNHDDNA